MSSFLLLVPLLPFTSSRHPPLLDGALPRARPRPPLRLLRLGRPWNLGHERAFRQRNDFIASQASDPQFASFIVNNDIAQPRHVVLNFGKALPTLNQALLTWLTDMATDAPWENTSTP
ncbi:hypothetical protein [Chondromyces apiculatus]|uniref:Uncharacterized protein n=1 Tax=Chondromyces apiculatus DSM 436 TaxID=1192034 RepID=A0A017T073_9BACT|nr:hypothetical protein [Chondromyces apiculatus]EYF02598.1 Hypothetical protein CAP_6709 [Chondromyces apiculatus DSM 436]